MGENNLDKSKYFYFMAIINAPKESPSVLDILRGYEEHLHNDLTLGCVFLATIIHDKDIEENGKPKRPHLHAFLEFPHIAKGFTTLQVLKRLKKALNCNDEQIGIQGSQSELLLVQYLTHQNHKEKAQYSSDLITTNDTEVLEQRLNTKYVSPSDKAKNEALALQECKTLLELMNTIGLDKANKYRNTFNQIKTEQGQSYDKLARKHEQLKDDFIELYHQLFKILGLIKHNALLPEDIEEANNLLQGLGLFYDELLSNH